MDKEGPLASQPVALRWAGPSVLPTAPRMAIRMTVQKNEREPLGLPSQVAPTASRGKWTPPSRAISAVSYNDALATRQHLLGVARALREDRERRGMTIDEYYDMVITPYLDEQDRIGVQMPGYCMAVTLSGRYCMRGGRHDGFCHQHRPR